MASTMQSRFQVSHPQHGLLSVHRNLMLALSSARAWVRKLKAERDPSPEVEIYDLMAKVGATDLWLVTGTSGTSADYAPQRMREAAKAVK